MWTPLFLLTMSVGGARPKPNIILVLTGKRYQEHCISHSIHKLTTLKHR